MDGFTIKEEARGPADIWTTQRVKGGNVLGQTPEEAFANPGIERDVLTNWERFLSGSGSAHCSQFTW